MSGDGHLQTERRGEMGVSYGLLFALMAVIIISALRYLMINLQISLSGIASNV